MHCVIESSVYVQYRIPISLPDAVLRRMLDYGNIFLDALLLNINEPSRELGSQIG